jgi:hypothetical protein
MITYHCTKQTSDIAKCAKDSFCLHKSIYLVCTVLNEYVR